MPCHCRYFHFEGDKNEWLARCAFEVDKNRAELEAAAASDDLEGVVALAPDGRVVGWMKLVQAERVPKLYEQRPYRGLPCFGGDRSGVFTVGCFLVDENERRKGVAKGLLRAGIDVARGVGARALEAFPRRAEDVSDAELFAGPFRLFVAEGFEVVNDFGPYPVLRLEL